MGLLEYAWSNFLERDHHKTKLIISSKYKYPQLYRDEIGFVSIFPEPVINKYKEEERISLMGYNSPLDHGRLQFLEIFKAAIIHLGAHVVASNFQDYETWKRKRNSRLARFIPSLIEDIGTYAYVSIHYPDNLYSLAYANALALKRLRPIDTAVNPATKLMARLLVQVHIGNILKTDKDKESISDLACRLDDFKKKTLVSVMDKNIDMREEKLDLANHIYDSILDRGTITECPSLPHTEELGNCSLLRPSYDINTDATLENDIKQFLIHFGRSSLFLENGEQAHKKLAEAEANQVFSSWLRQKEKDKMTIEKYKSFIVNTQFKSALFPLQDYAQYLRARASCKSEAHRLLESLLVARDALDEDPRKVYGVLDLQEIIQVIASKSPRMDVFMLDENLSKSYTWVILLDASKSMEYLKDFAEEILISLAEVANNLLLDPTSWGIYAFNDRLLVIKDIQERYNARIKSRIGGIEFEGFTYLPDALKIAAQVIKSRAENLRLITVVSDGWVYGYPEMTATLTGMLNKLEGTNIALLGIGVKSRQMQLLFKNCSTVYSLRDLTKKFSELYMSASRTAAEN